MCVYLYEVWVSSGGELASHNSEAVFTQQEAAAFPFPGGEAVAGRIQLWGMGVEYARGGPTGTWFWKAFSGAGVFKLITEIAEG